MKNYSQNTAAGNGGLAALRWAFTATLALVLAALLGYALAWPAYYAFASVQSLEPYLPSIAALLFTLATVGSPMFLAYLYFSGRTAFVTGWSQKLHPFFHLDSHLPGFPEVLGWNYRSVGMTFKKVAAWAFGGLALVYLFDYLNGSLIIAGPAAPASAEQIQSSAAAAPLTAEQMLASMSGVNFFISALVMVLVTAFIEEILFRGIMLNLWRAAFDEVTEGFDEEAGTVSRYLRWFFAVCGSYIAVIIAAALFAVAHLDAVLSQFFFGLVAGVIYLQTRTLWAPILMHILNNAVVPLFLLISSLSVFNGGADHAAMAPQLPVVASPAELLNKSEAAHHQDHEGAQAALGLRVPGVQEIIRSSAVGGASAAGKPLVDRVSQEDLNKEDFAASGNVFIQVCRSSDCDAQLAVMENLARQFSDVEFVQADAGKNSELVKRLEAEQAAMGKGGEGKVSAAVVYPAYIYVNNAMQILPDDKRSEADLIKFIKINYMVYDVAGSESDEAMPFVSKLCNPDNQGAFDGKVLYACVYDTVVNSDLALLDPAKRSQFVQKWQHRYDGSTALATEDSTAVAIRSMLADLNEMHTNFFTAKQNAALAQSFDATVVGIGAPLARLNMASKLKALPADATPEQKRALTFVSEETPMVIYPRPSSGSPAEKAGLLGGDRLVEVDGKPAVGRTVDEIVAAIRGPAGTNVTLKIARMVNGVSEIHSFSIERARVQSKEVVAEKLDNGFAKLRIGMFGNKVSREFTDTLYSLCTGKQLPAEGRDLAQVVNQYRAEHDCSVKGLVIDLRGNPGGRLDQVVEMMQAVMKEGTIVTTLTREGDQVIEVKESVTEGALLSERIVDGKSVKKTESPRFWRVLPVQTPVVVLVDEYSASASELMTAALQKNGLAVVVGEPSFGKEVGQAINQLDFGTMAKITSFRFKPGGEDLGVAVLPDFEVAASTAFLDNPAMAPDLAMDKALALLTRGKEGYAEGKASAAQKETMAAAAAQAHKLRDEQVRAAALAGLDLE